VIVELTVMDKQRNPTGVKINLYRSYSYQQTLRGGTQIADIFKRSDIRNILKKANIPACGCLRKPYVFFS